MSTAEGINSVSHPAHLEDDGKVAFHPVTHELLFTSHTLFFSPLAKLAFTPAVILGSQLTSSSHRIFLQRIIHCCKMALNILNIYLFFNINNSFGSLLMMTNIL